MLFGVYELLERLRCRFFGPLEEHVPRHAEMSIPPLDASESPSLNGRGLDLIGGADRAVVDWMAKVKFDVAWPERDTPNSDLSIAPPASMQESAVLSLLTGLRRLERPVDIPHRISSRADPWESPQFFRYPTGPTYR